MFAKPLTISLSHQLTRRLTKVRKTGELLRDAAVFERIAAEVGALRPASDTETGAPVEVAAPLELLQRRRGEAQTLDDDEIYDENDWLLLHSAGSMSGVSPSASLATILFSRV